MKVYAVGAERKEIAVIGALSEVYGVIDSYCLNNSIDVLHYRLWHGDVVMVDVGSHYVCFEVE